MYMFCTSFFKVQNYVFLFTPQIFVQFLFGRKVKKY